MSPRVAIVVLVLLVVLLVVALGSGACSGRGGANDAKAGPLGGLLGGLAVKPLDLSTVTANPAACRSGQLVVLAPNQTCHLTVPRDGPATRRLQVLQGVMTVTFTPADSTFGGSQTAVIPSSDTSTIDVVSPGGALDLTCRPPTFCVVRGGS